MRTILITLLLFLFSTAQAGDDLFLYQGLDKEAAKAVFQKNLGYSVDDANLRSIPNVGLPVTDDIWFLGAPQGERCDPEVRRHIDEITGGGDQFELMLELARTDLDYLNIEAARDQLNLIVTAIPCATSLIAKKTLARIFLYRGINAFYIGTKDEARRSFRVSAELSGRAEWDEEYSVEAGEVYREVIAQREAYGRTDLAYRLPGLNLTEFYVDGETLSLKAGNAVGLLRVLPGTHVLQWKRSQGEIETRVVEVPESAILVSRFGLQELLALPPEVGEQTLTGRVQETFFAQAGGVVSVLLVNAQTSEPEMLYTYNGKVSGTSTPVTYTIGKPVDLTNREVPVRYQPIELRFGGGYVLETTVTGAVIADFWLRPGIAVEFGADVAFTGYLGLTDADNRVFVLPSLRAGVRFEFRPERLVKPYAFVVARVSFGSDPRVLAGPILGGGATFMFKSLNEKARAFGFFIEVSAGPLFSEDRPRGTFVGLAGLTFRPYTHLK